MTRGERPSAVVPDAVLSTRSNRARATFREASALANAASASSSSRTLPALSSSSCRARSAFVRASTKADCRTRTSSRAPRRSRSEGNTTRRRIGWSLTTRVPTEGVFPPARAIIFPGNGASMSVRRPGGSVINPPIVRILLTVSKRTSVVSMPSRCSAWGESVTVDRADSGTAFSTVAGVESGGSGVVPQCKELTASTTSTMCIGWTRTIGNRRWVIVQSSMCTLLPTL